MILLDTSGLLAALVGNQNSHAAAADALRRASPPLLVSPFVLAELDYLLTTLASVDVALRLLDDVARGSYRPEPFSAEDVAAAGAVMRQRRDLGVSLTDASIVVLSRRTGCTDVLTLDERHFRVLRGHGGRPFAVLPADAVT